MRALSLAVAVLLLAAAPAAADFTRLPVPPADRILLAGGRLYVSSGATLVTSAPDGSGMRAITLPRTPEMLDYVSASRFGLAVGVFPRRSYYRAHGGRWH